MPPLAFNNTRRYFVDYDQGGYNHTLMVRPANLTTFTEIENALDAFLTANAGHISKYTVVQCRISEAHSDVSFPVGSSLVGNVYGTADVIPNVAPLTATYIGRSGTGRRVRLSLFGFYQPLSGWRYTAAEASGVAAALAVLRGNPAVFHAIDDTAAIWLDYANINANDHWVKNVRSG